MTPRTAAFVASLILVACLSGPALAQTASPGPAGTPGASTTDAIPPAAGGAGDRTGSIAATGQTKPPGAATGDRLGTSAEVDERTRQVDRQISKGICKGC